MPNLKSRAPISLIYREYSMNHLRIAVLLQKKKPKKVYLLNVVVSNINIYCLCFFNVDGYRICWALLYIKLCVDNHCHKYSTDCKYNITLQFHNIFKAGKYKGLKAYIVKKKPRKNKGMYSQTTLCRHEICLKRKT